MRFMVIVKATPESETGALPDPEMLEKMGAFNDELVKAGIILAMDGLHASAKGARIRFDGERRTVTDGPFAETKELISGYWLIDVKSKEEAIAWMSRAPFDGGAEIELRQVFELEEFSALMTDEHRARAERFHRQAQ